MTTITNGFASLTEFLTALAEQGEDVSATNCETPYNNQINGKGMSKISAAYADLGVGLSQLMVEMAKSEAKVSETDHDERPYNNQIPALIDYWAEVLVSTDPRDDPCRWNTARRHYDSAVRAEEAWNRMTVETFGLPGAEE